LSRGDGSFAGRQRKSRVTSKHDTLEHEASEGCHIVLVVRARRGFAQMKTELVIMQRGLSSSAERGLSCILMRPLGPKADQHSLAVLVALFRARCNRAGEARKWPLAPAPPPGRMGMASQGRALITGAWVAQ